MRSRLSLLGFVVHSRTQRATLVLYGVAGVLALQEAALLRVLAVVVASGAGLVRGVGVMYRAACASPRIAETLRQASFHR